MDAAPGSLGRGKEGRSDQCMAPHGSAYAYTSPSPLPLPSPSPLTLHDPWRQHWRRSPSWRGMHCPMLRDLDQQGLLAIPGMQRFPCRICIVSILDHCAPTTCAQLLRLTSGPGLPDMPEFLRFDRGMRPATRIGQPSDRFIASARRGFAEGSPGVRRGLPRPGRDFEEASKSVGSVLWTRSHSETVVPGARPAHLPDCTVQ